MYCLDDTITAVASPPGGAARGIVRVSGPNAPQSVARFFRGEVHSLPDGSRRSNAMVGSLDLPALDSPLPCDAYFWPAGRSYTGQPVVELHTIGSPPLLQVLMRSLLATGVRQAGPGEFTLRAFLAGRLDLSRAEAVLGVIDAADRRELDVALRQLAGGLSRPLLAISDSLLDLLSHLEAGFDFADEDIPFIGRQELLDRLDEAAAGIAKATTQAASRGEAAGRKRVVLVGRPNVGKSCLFNTLAGGGTVALVADQSGTTRDYLAAELALDGIMCQLIDTAGANATNGTTEPSEPAEDTDAAGVDETAEKPAVESAAQAAAVEQSRNADIQVLCIDSTRAADEWEASQLREGDDRRRVIAWTKCDAAGAGEPKCAVLRTSGLTGEGIDRLRAELRRRLLSSQAGESDIVADTALRCRESLRVAGLCIGRARQVAVAGQDELAAAEIRTALTELGKVFGTVYTDDVLERIFSRFCVGK